MTSLITFLSFFLLLYCVYQLSSLAGIFSEKSGTANVAIEGNMIVGGVLFALMYQNIDTLGLPIAVTVFSALIISVLLSSVYMMLLGLLTTRYMADHIVAGTGMNLLAPVLMLLIYNLGTTIELGEGIRASNILFSIPEWNVELSVGNTVNTDLNLLDFIFLFTTIAIVVISTFVLNKTTFGLRLKTSGENPYSLETSGVSVTKTRLMSLFIAGLLSSLSGAVFLTKGTFFFTVNGSGFLAIGILILGQYKISGTVIGSIVLAALISLFDVLPLAFGGSQFVENYSYLLKVVPFIIPLIGLIIFRKSYTPKAVGTNFKKDQR